jgi:hypothetical protein
MQKEDVPATVKLSRRSGEDRTIASSSFGPQAALQLSSSSSPPHRESVTEQEDSDEGVLRDILSELDRERTRRAELEAQIRVLTDVLKGQDTSAAAAATGNTVTSEEISSSEPSSDCRPNQEEEEVATESEVSAARHRVLALEVQVNGLQRLVNALTAGKPALANASTAASSEALTSLSASAPDPAAASLTRPTMLPLHTLRLLEIIPWEAHEHIHGADVLYEWQVMVKIDPHHHPSSSSSWTWQSQLRYFPTWFAKDLPVVTPEGAEDGKRSKGRTEQPASASHQRSSLLEFLAGAGTSSSAGGGGGSGTTEARTSKGIVGTTITDENLTFLYNLEGGYPLPSEGTWEWIGGWRVVLKKRSPLVTGAASAKSADHHLATTHLDCDSDGWSYASEPKHFVTAPEMVWDSPFDRRTAENGGALDYHHDDLGLRSLSTTPESVVDPVRTFRRRKWIRRRILVDYPHASERTREYLKVLADTARLSVTLDKVSNQLVETKTRLTETEAELMRVKSELLMRESELQAALSNRSNNGLGIGVATSHRRDGSGGGISLSGGSTAVKSAVLGSVEGLHDILSSKASQWVHSSTRKGSDDLSSSLNRPADSAGSGDIIIASSRVGEENGGMSEEHDGSSSSAQHRDELSDSQHNSRFDWKKIGRGSLLERLAKGGHHRASEASTISTTRSSGSASIPEEAEVDKAS